MNKTETIKQVQGAGDWKDFFKWEVVTYEGGMYNYYTHKDMGQEHDLQIGKSYTFTVNSKNTMKIVESEAETSRNLAIAAQVALKEAVQTYGITGSKDPEEDPAKEILNNADRYYTWLTQKL